MRSPIRQGCPLRARETGPKPGIPWGTRLAPPWRVTVTHSEKKAPEPTRDDRPLQDEWGIFDPEQAGFTAVLRKIEEKARTTPAQQPRKHEETNETFLVS